MGVGGNGVTQDYRLDGWLRDGRLRLSKLLYRYSENDFDNS
jgi:hypothetical protein